MTTIPQVSRGATREDPLFGLQRTKGPPKFGPDAGFCTPGNCYRMIDFMRLHRPEDYSPDMYRIYDCPDSNLSEQCSIEYNRMLREEAEIQEVSVRDLRKEVRDVGTGQQALGPRRPADIMVGGAAPSLLAYLAPVY